jgi:hypothetical protein
VTSKNLFSIPLKDSTFLREYLTNRKVLNQFPGPRNRLEFTEQILDQVIWEFRTWMLKKAHEKQIAHNTILVPLTWWDHLKQDYLPNWFIQRYPVKYKTIEYTTHSTQNFICPHDDQAWTDDPTVHICWMENGKP